MGDGAHDKVQSRLLCPLPHGFFGHGGLVGSQGARFQFGYGGEGAGGGDKSAIAAARRSAVAAIGSRAVIVAPHQLHSSDVIKVEEGWSDSSSGRPHADALVTRSSRFALAIVTADCAPVLFADSEAKVIGAAHAGWRGAAGGVLENTLAAMETLGARRANIAAAIGPCIAQANYEVDRAFRERFDRGADRFFAPGREGHWQFDLSGYAAARMSAAGVDKIDQLALDTYALEERYFSYRRAVHRGEESYGRQISLIALA